ncbi:MAG: heme-binding protein [Micropepsaceae bacterium]
MYRTKMILVGIALALAMQNTNAAEEVPDEMPFNIPYGAPISVETAKIAVEAAAAEAERRGWKLAIAVVSPAGDLTYYMKMNDTQLASSEISVGKARTAARFRRATAVFHNAMETGHPYVATLHSDVVASPGGIPIVINGELIGAIGCSGATGAQDALACQVGIDAIAR